MSALPNGYSHIEFDATFHVKACYKGPNVSSSAVPLVMEESLEALQALQSLQGVRLPLKSSASTPRAEAPRLPTDYMPKAGCGCRKR